MAETIFVLDNALITNEGVTFEGYVVISGREIAEVGTGRYEGSIADVRDLKGKWLLPGVIDTHVHFREPGMERKADILHESRAAAAGGVTSIFDMPNCVPPTVTTEAVVDKHRRATQDSAVNFTFYIGASADNLQTLRRTDFSIVPGIKLFLGSSTGGMKVNGDALLDSIFAEPRIISVHSEEQAIIDSNIQKIKRQYPDGDVPVSLHPAIRSTKACEECTRGAVERAKRLGTHLHVLHISTERELSFFSNNADIEQKRLTAEACVQHLWFDDSDYDRLGAYIKCNPSIKTAADRDALRRAVADGTIDVVSTDHAPHEKSDKEGGALKAASGIPLIQFSFPAMLELSQLGHFSKEKVVEVMSHNPARLFGIERRGFIRPGYYADIVIVDPQQPLTVTPEIIKSKCGWSPFEGHTFPVSVAETYINGRSAGATPGMALRFKRSFAD